MVDNTSTRIPYQQNNPIPYQQQPIRVNHPIRSYKKKKKKKSKATYKTPCNYIIGFIVPVLFIFGVVVFSIMLGDGISSGQSQTILIAFIPLILL